MRKIYHWSEERSKGTLNAFNLWKLKSLPPEKKAIKKRNYVMLLRKGCQITTPAYFKTFMMILMSRMKELIGRV
jgi:hypothetical protein